tara:strand:+ start:899 stop:1156 length:258 start_codon:yes stop_codon:yes gene_type:complete
MKFADLIFQIFISLVITFILLFWFSSYNSAFEADRACHSQLSNYLEGKENLGCDHDTETHQWILYENQDGSPNAKIIKRFRYRFL